MFSHALALLIVVPLFAAFFTPIAQRISHKFMNLWVIFSLGISECLVLVLARNVIKGDIQIYTLGADFPSLASPAGFPIRIILAADAIAVFMALISVFIALLIGIYSWRFMERYKSRDKYYTLALSTST